MWFPLLLGSSLDGFELQLAISSVSSVVSCPRLTRAQLVFKELMYHRLRNTLHYSHGTYI